MSESVCKGIFKYSISTWANLLIGFLSVIVTTRLMTPDVYGQVAIFFSASSVLMYTLTIGFDGALIRFYNEPPQNNTKNELIYKCIAYSCIICFVVGGCVTLFAGDIISERLFNVGSRITFGLLVLYTFTNIILRYFNISFRMSFKAKQYTIQNIIINCLSRVLIIAAAFIISDFTFIATVMTIGLTCVLILYTYVQKDEILPYNTEGTKNYSLSLKGYGEFVKFALFSAPTYIVFYLNDYLNKQIIVSAIGVYAVGIFSSSSLFGSILTGLKGGFNTYWSAYVYKNYQTEKKKITEMHDYVVLFSIFAASLLVVIRDVIYLLIGTDFHASKAFFSLLLAMPLLSFILETTNKGIAIAKKNQITFFSHTAAVTINLISCIVLTKIWGLTGAAIANMLSAVLLYVLNTFYGQKYYSSIASYAKSVFGVVLMILILVSASIFSDIMSIIITVIIIDIIAIIVYRKPLFIGISVIKSFLKK